MRIQQFMLAVVLGSTMVLSLLVSLASAGDPDNSRERQQPPVEPPGLSAAANNPGVKETNLTPGGSIYEVNPDAQGNLWLSDYGAAKVWQINRATAAYTIYNGLKGAQDARRDARGDIWWTNFDNGRLGRIALAAGTVTTYTLPGAISPWGTALDAAGQVWVTDNNGPRVYRFNLTTTQVCSYTVPNSGRSTYIVHNAGSLWFGDISNDRLVKLDPTTNLFTFWQLPFNSAPLGLAVDGSDNLWWAESGFAALGRLEPGLNRVTTYTLPIGPFATMISINNGSIWYTGGASTFGTLDPTAAISSSIFVTSSTLPTTPACAILGAGITSTPVISTGVATFTSGVVTPTVISGFTVYQLPAGATPWGIANVDGIWVGDQGRDKLVWLSYPLYLPLVLK